MSEHERALAAGVALLERAIDYTLGSLRVVTPAALCRATPCTGWNLQRLLGHMDDSLRTLHEAATGHIPPIPTQPLRAQTGDPSAGPRQATPGEAGGPPACARRITPDRWQGSVGRLGGAAAAASGAGTGAGSGRAAGRPPHPPAWGQPSTARGCNPALLVRDGATEVLGRWTAMITDNLVFIDDRHLTSPMVAAVGAIEIAVHGWDVARACGEHRPIPPLLAEELLDLAHLFVTPHDRPTRFAPPVPVAPFAPAQDHLLAYLGRHPNWYLDN